jgi:hypothetical protein
MKIVILFQLGVSPFEFKETMMNANNSNKNGAGRNK